MRSYLRRAAFAVLLIAAACSDQATQSGTDDLPFPLPEPSLDIVDANNNEGNPHFYWLKPIFDADAFEGVADPSIRPTVEICPRNTAGDACDDAAPVLVRFTRDTGPDQDRIKVDDKDHYFVHWRMNSHTPERGGIYRIRVTLQGQEFGHVDVVTLRNKEIKAYVSDPAGDVIPISDNGAFKIAFRIEEGALEAAFCDFDGDQDVADCNVAVEQPGDGKPTTVTVKSDPTSSTSKVVAVIKAPDAVFKDINGTPVENVVVTAEVEVNPPSKDLILDDSQELPYFVEVNTFPGDVYIDPAGPGVEVIVCQDDDELANRGITDNLHSQLILYKVGDNGVTRRLTSTFGVPECDGFVPAPPASGVLGMLRQGAARAMSLVMPTPLKARRLHGGLNTTITRDVSLDEAFSTFGAALGPNADSTDAALPLQGAVGTPVPITIQVRNALGEPLALGGDDPTPVIIAGPSTGAAVTVTDNGGGLYSASYTPLARGIDTIQITLTRADGLPLGAIGGSPYTLEIVCALPGSLPVVTVVPGADCSTPTEVPDFETAMEVVQSGGTILAGNGTHVVHNLVIDKPLTISEASGATAVVQNDTARQSFLVDGVASGTVLIEKIDFVNNAPGVNVGPQRSASVRAKGTYDQVVIQDNTFTNTDPTSNSGARADTTTVPGATVLIQRNSFTGGRTGVVATGVFETGDPFVTVRENTFGNHSARGVQLQVGADGNVEDNDLSGCGGSCIWYQNQSNGTISGNVADDCGPSGCIVALGGTVDVLGNTVSSDSGLPADPNAVPFHSTIFYGSGAVGKVNDNVVSRCGWGVCIQIGSGATAEVRNNHVTAHEADDTESGIWGWGGFSDNPVDNNPPTLTAVTGNTVVGLGNGSGGVTSADHYAFKISGIGLRNASAGVVSDNSVTNAATGIQLYQNATISSGSDNVVDQTGTALLSYKNSSATLSGNDFTNWSTAIQDLDNTLSGNLQCNWWGTTAGPVGFVPAAMAVAFYAPFADGPVANGGAGSCATQAGLFYWDPAGGGNGHFYEWVNVGSIVRWTDARAAATTRTAYGAVSGHLVTITSAAEGTFLQSMQTDSLSVSWRPWIGLTDEVTEGTFQWVTGEALSYTNWASGEPNNLTGEDYVEMFGSGVWNDAPNVHSFTKSYLVEYPASPAAAPVAAPAMVQPLNLRGAQRAVSGGGGGPAPLH